MGISQFLADLVSYRVNFYKTAKGIKKDNSVFSKTMEKSSKTEQTLNSLRIRKKLLKLTSKPAFVTSKILNEKLVAVHKIKETLTINRQAYVGMCILDLNKTLKYDFHYNYNKKNIMIKLNYYSQIQIH